MMIEIFKDNEWVRLGEIISSTNHTEVDTFTCVGSGPINMPRQTTTTLEIILAGPATMFSEPKQRFKVFDLEIETLVTRQDLIVGNHGIGLIMEWIVLDSKTILGRTEVALQSCLDTQEFNEDLL